MSRDIFNCRIDYNYCKYLIDYQCTCDECKICGRYPPLNNCKTTGHCKHFEKEDGEIYGQKPSNKA